MVGVVVGLYVIVFKGGGWVCVLVLRWGWYDCWGGKMGLGCLVVLVVVVGWVGMWRIILGSEVVVGVVWMEGGDGDLDLDFCIGSVDVFFFSDICVMFLIVCLI